MIDQNHIVAERELTVMGFQIPHGMKIITSRYVDEDTIYVIKTGLQDSVGAVGPRTFGIIKDALRA